MQKHAAAAEPQQYVLAISDLCLMPNQMAGECAAVAAVRRPTSYGVPGHRIPAARHGLHLRFRSNGMNSVLRKIFSPVVRQICDFVALPCEDKLSSTRAPTITCAPNVSVRT